MHVAIWYRSGVHVEGRVLFYDSRFLRVMISGKTHPSDFWYRNGVWSSDCGDPVQVDLPVVSEIGEVSAARAGLANAALLRMG